MSLVEMLEWDSAFFGFPIGRALANVAPWNVEALVSEADDRGLQCTYLLVPSDDVALLESALRNAFVVRDVRVQLERPVDGHVAAMAGLRRAELSDLPDLEGIVRTRFTRTRFFADDGFPRARSSELYVEWLSRALKGDDDRVTLMSDEATGFIVCELDQGACRGAISLIAVAENATRRGLGSSLVAGAGALFIDSGLETAQVVTQGRNLEAIRLYEANGYRTSDVSLWLHRWRR